MTNQWAIIDDHGIIYQGFEEQIRAIWGKRNDSNELDNVFPAREGDLMLIEIHEVEA